MTAPILKATGIVKEFVRNGKTLRAVGGVDLELHPGETLAVVGESGCGKSTLARCILRLIEPTAGEVELAGQRITGMSRAELRRTRAKAQMVFQDPRDALNPKMRVGQLIAEPLSLHSSLSADERQRRVVELLELVKLNADFVERRPRTLSGGQLQRVGIARALASEPDLVILDEPVSALDQSVRAGILQLLDDIQRERSVAYLHISHDLASLRRFADRVLVMRQGEVVETGRVVDVLADPQHEYTKLLIGSVITIDHRPDRGVTS